jgi:hypothetical protein
MAETPVISMVLFLLAAFFGALGQFLYKSGSQLASGGWQSYLFNPRLIGGVACYIAVMVLFVAAPTKPPSDMMNAATAPDAWERGVRWGARMAGRGLTRHYIGDTECVALWN